jgi:hypothetical protein
MRSFLSTLSLFGLLSVTAFAQEPPDLMREPWPARWITHPTADAEAFGVYLFRNELNLEALPDAFPIRISADNRYKLFVNGVYVGKGPARGDLLNWRFETYDLKPYLQAGLNVVAVQVWNFGEHKPVAQVSRGTALIVQGVDSSSAGLNTGTGQWRVHQDTAYAPIKPSWEDVMGYFVVGPGEEMDVSAHPWGWKSPEFSTAKWLTPKAQGQGIPIGITKRHSGLPAYQLVARQIPPMEEKTMPLGRIRRASLKLPDQGVVYVPANTKATVLIDHGTLTTAYPELKVTSGGEATLRLFYAEGLRDSTRKKGHRDSIGHKTLYGFHDGWKLSEGRYDLTTLWWRTFRYIRVEIETKDAPVAIDQAQSRFTAYPFEERAVFDSGQELLSDIWSVSWRTQRLCAGENYFDCPYYEQLQYVGDTRIQALISYYVSGDHRLFRKAVSDFYQSRMPFGLTQSRYPSRDIQIIPPYSLFWIAMLYDYWMHVGEPEWIAGMLPAVADILQWYDNRIAEDGLLGPQKWWNFADWVPGPGGWQGGVPPGAESGGSALLSLQLAYNLQLAAELYEAFGEPGRAGIYRSRAADINDGLRKHCWDEERQLFADTPEKASYSQHVNTMAVLTDALPEAAQPALLQRLLKDTTLTPCSYYYAFYITEALEKTGLGDTYFEHLGPWEEQLDLGLTTFVEAPGKTRSDCHAWSASPAYHFLSLVAGIRPAAPGFSKVRITPHLNGLKELRANLPHPKGDIEVEYREAEGRLEGNITLPPGLEGTLNWNGQMQTLKSGPQAIKLR